MTGERLTLRPGRWYGWTMWPGYGSTYYSPIRVDGIEPHRTGQRRFGLDFLNLGYASGVQIMRYELETLKREAAYLLAARIDGDRAVAIEPLTPDWMQHHFPRLYREAMFEDGVPVEREMMRLAG